MEISKRRELPYPPFWCEIVVSVTCDITGNAYPPVFDGPGNVRIQEHNPQAAGIFCEQKFAKSSGVASFWGPSFFKQAFFHIFKWAVAQQTHCI